MIDILALGIVHVLLSLAAWRLVNRPSLNADEPPAASPRNRDA